jgi:hypothetical protein
VDASVGTALVRFGDRRVKGSLERPPVRGSTCRSRRLELAVWESYGLFHEVEPFLRALPEPDADRALRDIASMIAELRTAGLESQLDKAQDLRRAVLAAAEAFTEYEEVSG